MKQEILKSGAGILRESLYGIASLNPQIQTVNVECFKSPSPDTS
jgi:hypothetical protein